MNLDVVLENIAYDRFMYDNKEFVVLNSLEFTKENLKNNLMLAQVYREAGRNEIVPIDEELYDEVVNFYFMLKSAFMAVDDQEEAND